MNMKEFENRWKRMQGSSKTQTVDIVHKDGTTSFTANAYIIEPDPRVKLVYLYLDGHIIGAIKLDSIATIEGWRWG